MFSQKQTKKTVLKLDEKNLLFMFFIISFFSISPLRVRWRLPYIVKDDSSKADFRTA